MMIGESQLVVNDFSEPDPEPEPESGIQIFFSDMIYMIYRFKGCRNVNLIL